MKRLWAPFAAPAAFNDASWNSVGLPYSASKQSKCVRTVTGGSSIRDFSD
jgi:hypothetical protein